MSISGHNIGNYNFSIKLTGIHVNMFMKLACKSTGDFEHLMMKIVERGLIELTGELPENRSQNGLEG